MEDAVSDLQTIYEESITEAVEAMEQAYEALESAGNYPNTLERLRLAIEDTKFVWGAIRLKRLEAERARAEKPELI